MVLCGLIKIIDNTMTSLWRALFTANIVLLVLLMLAFPFLQTGSASYVISVVSLGIVTLSLIGLGILIRYEWNPF